MFKRSPGKPVSGLESFLDLTLIRVWGKKTTFELCNLPIVKRQTSLSLLERQKRIQNLPIVDMAIENQIRHSPF